MNKDLLQTHIQQAIIVVQNFLKIYQYLIEDLEIKDADLILLGKEKGRYMQLMSSLQTLRLYQKKLKEDGLNPILMVESLFEDFVNWIKNIENICENNMTGIPLNIFEQIFKESYTQIYTEQESNENKSIRSEILPDSAITDADDDW